MFSHFLGTNYYKVYNFEATVETELFGNFFPYEFLELKTFKTKSSISLMKSL